MIDITNMKIGRLLTLGCLMCGLLIGTTIITPLIATGNSPEQETTVTPLTVERLQPGLIAYYPLRSNALDATRKNPPITLKNAPFQEGGVYCNGLYIYDSKSTNQCNVQTPRLKHLNANSFSISAKFKVSEFGNRPVFVGGEDTRWIGFYLKPDGKIALLYKNDNIVACNLTYRLNTWHRGIITYDGNVAKVYLDGVLGCQVSFKFPGLRIEEDVALTDFSRGYVFKGILKDLTIYNRVIQPSS